jgi:rod shape determining protein RodA
MQLRIERRMIVHVPWVMLFAALAIAALGVWNLASASHHAGKIGELLQESGHAAAHGSAWMGQAAFVLVGLALIAVAALFDYKLLYRVAVPFYALAFAAELALKIAGHRAKGAESWLQLGPVRFQPSEFVKIGIVLMLAAFFHDDYRPNDPGYGFLRLIRPVLIAVVPAALILSQPDLGSTMMILFTAITVILFARVRWWVIASMVVGLAALSGVIWNDYIRDPSDGHRTVVRQLLKKHQSRRIESWLNPDADVKGAAYHAAQSMIAVGSGELAGKGWGQGTQTGLSFLPEQHTDFIFSVWAEEHGFVLCVLLLFLYGVLLLSSLTIGMTARDRFGAFVAVGVTSMIFWQVFDNIGMVIGVLPVTGITLPLMSYGGSSMLSVSASIGLLVNISMRRHVF